MPRRRRLSSAACRPPPPAARTPSAAKPRVSSIAPPTILVCAVHRSQPAVAASPHSTMACVRQARTPLSRAAALWQQSRGHQHAAGGGHSHEHSHGHSHGPAAATPGMVEGELPRAVAARRRSVTAPAPPPPCWSLLSLLVQPPPCQCLLASSPAAVVAIDPLLLLEPERLPAAEAAAAGGGTAAHVPLMIPFRLLALLHKGHLVLADHDDPGNHWWACNQQQQRDCGLTGTGGASTARRLPAFAPRAQHSSLFRLALHPPPVQVLRPAGRALLLQVCRPAPRRVGLHQPGDGERAGRRASRARAAAKPQAGGGRQPQLARLPAARARQQRRGPVADAYPAVSVCRCVGVLGGMARQQQRPPARCWYNSRGVTAACRHLPALLPPPLAPAGKAIDCASVGVYTLGDSGSGGLKGLCLSTEYETPGE